MLSTQFSEGYFVERASSGRFCKLEASDGDTRTRGKRPPILQEKILNDQFAFIGFLFVQGIISGLNVSALYEAFTLDSPKMFVEQHLASRANNMILRCFFIGITFCVTGSLCMLKKNDVSHLFAIISGSSSSTRNITKSDWGIWCSILSYFVALILTLMCYHVDVRMSNMSTQIHVEKLLSILHQWQGFIVPRSILCFVAWLISCYRFVINRRPSPWTEESFI